MAEMPEEIDFEDVFETTEIEHEELPLIFISYDTGDLELVKAIKAVLLRIFGDKIKTFVARHNIKPGDDAFQVMIHENLAKSAVVLAVCTKGSLTSPWLWFESGAGFGCGSIIPLWAGVEPKIFGPPMTIFQGKRLEDKEEMEELVTKLAGCTGVTCEDYSLTDKELENLLQINTKLKNKQSAAKIRRIEDEIRFSHPTPNEEMPVQYLIEAHFPFTKSIPLQHLMEGIEKSRFFLAHFSGSKYPMLDRGIENIDNDVSILNKLIHRPYSNQERQIMFIKSDNVTLTRWVRDYLSGGSRLILSSEFIDETARLFLFFCNLAKHFGLPAIDMRIKLFDLEGGVLHVDGSSPGLSSIFKAPVSNEIEIMHTVTINNAENDLVVLLMHVWEKFKSSDGRFPHFDEKVFLTFLHGICEV